MLTNLIKKKYFLKVNQLYFIITYFLIYTSTNQCRYIYFNQRTRVSLYYDTYAVLVVG